MKLAGFTGRDLMSSESCFKHVSHTLDMYCWELRAKLHEKVSSYWAMMKLDSNIQLPRPVTNGLEESDNFCQKVEHQCPIDCYMLMANNGN